MSANICSFPWHLNAGVAGTLSSLGADLQRRPPLAPSEIASSPEQTLCLIAWELLDLAWQMLASHMTLCLWGSLSGVTIETIMYWFLAQDGRAMIVGFQNIRFSSKVPGLGFMDMLYNGFGNRIWLVCRFGSRGQVARFEIAEGSTSRVSTEVLPSSI
jgi:hypothetical protein